VQGCIVAFLFDIEGLFITHWTLNVRTLEETSVFHDAFFVMSTYFYVNNDIGHNIKMFVVTSNVV